MMRLWFCCPLLLVSLSGCVSRSTGTVASEETAAAKPSSVKLGVLVVFDQMRGDYTQRWRSLFGEGGFKKMQQEGANFLAAHCPYAWTSTSPGHASISTGATPSVHGIIENDWYDRAAREQVSGSEEDRYARVPTLASDLPKGLFRAEDRGAGSPGRMLAPTIGEALKQANSRSRVFSLGLKDRGAILLGGAKVDACYWFDPRSGTFATSTYYRDGLHSWVTRFNRERLADSWFPKTWDRLRDDIDYEKHSGPDDVYGEDIGYYQGRTFPHPMNARLPAPGKDYYRAITFSPFGNDLLYAFAKRAVEEEKLGQGEFTDLLCLAFSANDMVGHTWGPDSQEVLDITLRSDRLLADMIPWLEKTIGKDKFFLMVTSDHGIPPLFSVARQQGKPAALLRPGWHSVFAEEYLEKTYGVPPAKTRYIRVVSDFNIYLDHTIIERQGLKVNDVANTLAAWFRKQPEVEAAYTAQEQQDAKTRDEMARKVQKSYSPKRSGDVAVVPKAYHVGGGIGANHGSPHPYDTHVTMMVYGPGVKPGERKEIVSSLIATTIMARGLGIEPPAKAEASVPEGLFAP